MGSLNAEKMEFLKLTLLIRQTFQSAFTRKSDSEIPCKGTSSFIPMSEFTVDPNKIFKLLNGLNIQKASGSDGLRAMVLKEFILAFIYNESLRVL